MAGRYIRKNQQVVTAYRVEVSTEIHIKRTAQPGDWVIKDVDALLVLTDAEFKAQYHPVDKTAKHMEGIPDGKRTADS